MKTIKAPEDKLQPEFFDDEGLTWWANQLSPKALSSLQNGWQGVFRRSILKLLPAEQLGRHFSSDTGRPTKELYSMAGLMLIAEFKNLTGEQAAEAYTFDTSIQFALNLPRNTYLSARSVDTYRKLFRQDELAQQVFVQVSATLVQELQLNVQKQRLDSTHVCSRMAQLGRQQLLAVGVRRFVVQLKKHHAGAYQQLPEVLRERYAPAETRLFGHGTAHPQKPEQAIQQLGQDMAQLIGQYAQSDRISRMKSFQDMARLFGEHFQTPAAPGQPPPPRPQSKDKDGGSVSTLQNPSDADAGYNGKKGPGYQAQLAQALPPLDANGRMEGPGLITATLPQSASVRDNQALAQVLEQQQSSGLLPTELSADTIYGSDANVQYCAQMGIELISPVSGKAPTKAQPNHRCTKKEREQKQRLETRRQMQQEEAWKKRYAKRSGIEGLNRALDAVTGFKQLRVRGLQAVSMALYLKAAGWNILAAACILGHRRRQAGMLALSACFWHLGATLPRTAGKTQISVLGAIQRLFTQRQPLAA
jgi:hypothetical protein